MVLQFLNMSRGSFEKFSKKMRKMERGGEAPDQAEVSARGRIRTAPLLFEAGPDGFRYTLATSDSLMKREVMRNPPT